MYIAGGAKDIVSARRYSIYMLVVVMTLTRHPSVVGAAKLRVRVHTTTRGDPTGDPSHRQSNLTLRGTESP